MKLCLRRSLAVALTLLVAGCASAPSSVPAASSTSSASSAASSPAAPAYPTSTISIVVPFNAGSNTDSQIRFIQPYLEKALGVNTVVINNGGASGTIGVTDYLTQKPDGYTVLFSLPTPTVYKPTAGDTEYKTSDLVPVSRLSTAAMYLAVSQKSEFASAEDLINYIKEHPGDFTYANAGNGGIAHLAFASFLYGEGLDAQSIPFTGGTSECYTAVMGGHVMAYVVGEQELVGRDDVRPIINLGTKSTAEGFADIPTLSELGYSGYEINNFSGFYFMKGIDSAIVDAFDSAVQRTLAGEEFLAAAKQANFSHNYANAQDFSKQIADTVNLIAPVYEALAS